MPILREIVKEMSIKDKTYYMNQLPHKYLEENLIHAILINECDKLGDILNKIDLFIPYIDNWSVCDTINPKVFKKNPDLVYRYINKWINGSSYSIRFSVVTLLRFYLDEYKYDTNKLVCKIKSDDYYVNMAISWYFSVALIKQYDKTIKYFEEKKLSIFVHNKSIQKAIESYRISSDKKTYLKALKIK